MRVGKQSVQSNKSEEKQEIKKDIRASEDSKPKPPPADKPKVTFRKDSFEGTTGPQKTTTPASTGKAFKVSAANRQVSDAKSKFQKEPPSEQLVDLGNPFKPTTATRQQTGSASTPVVNPTGGSAVTTPAVISKGPGGTGGSTGAGATSQTILETAKSDPTAAADSLAQTLMDPTVSQQEKEALVIEIIETDPRMAARILNQAGQSYDPTNQLTDAERQAINRTVGQAWESSNPAGKTPATPGTSGTLDSADLGNLLSPRNMTVTPGQSGVQPHNLGNVFAASGSSSLQQSASTQMYDIGKETAAGNPVDGATSDAVSRDKLADSYFAGSALAASGSTSAALALMGHIDRTGSVEDFIARTSPVALTSNALGPDAEPALGKLMQAVGNQPASALLDKFFDESIRVATSYEGEGLSHPDAEGAVAELQKGLSQYFQTNMEHTTTRWATAKSVTDRATYASFASNVLFGGSFEGQQQLQQSFAAHIGKLAGEMQNVSPNDPDLDAKARKLGFLIGGAEVGFKRALDRVEDTNAAKKAMVDFIFNLATATGGAVTGAEIPDFSFGPIDINGSITDAIKQQVYAWVTEKAPEASELTLPLYTMALGIEDDYSDEMQSIRNSFHTDEFMTYLNEHG